MPDFFPWWQHGTLKSGLKNFAKSITITINGIIDQFSTNGIIIIVSNIAGLAVVPIFTTLRTIANIGIQVTTIMINPLVPDLIRFYFKEQHEKIKAVIEANWLASCLMVNVPFLVVFPFVEPLFTWWTKGQLQFDYVLYCTLTLSVSLVNYGKAYVTFLTGINHIKALSAITLIRCIIIFAVGIPVLKFFGIQGLGWVFLGAELASSVIIPYFFTQSLLRRSNVHFSAMQQFAALSPCLILAACYWAFAKESQSIIIILGLIFLLIVMGWQWSHLSLEIRTRISQVFLRMFPSK